MTDSIDPFNVRDRTTGELLSMIARSPIRKAPPLSELSRMTPAEMAGRLGIDRTGARTIQAALELSSRSRTLPKTRTLRTGASVADYFRERLQDHRKESFWALTLDQKHKPIDCHLISEGSLSATLVHPREAFNPVIRDSAAAVIFVHNHPSGDPDPSLDDRDLTRRLSECGHILGIRVLDHLVVGSDGHYSFEAHGEMRNEYGSRIADSAREKPGRSVRKESGKLPDAGFRRIPETSPVNPPEKSVPPPRERFRDDGRGR